MSKNKVVGIDGRSTPETWVSALNENISQVKNILAVIEWDDGGISIAGTSMEDSQRTYMTQMLDYSTMRLVCQGENE